MDNNDPFLQPLGVNIKIKTEVPIAELWDKSCVVPKGAILFRISKNTDLTDNMFFSFNMEGTRTNSFREHDLSKVQVWKVMEDITVPYRIISIDKIGKINSSLEVLYYHFFKSWERASLFKQYNHPNRSAFLQKLIDRGDNGWVSSIEDKADAELFLMNSVKEKQEQLSFVQYVGCAKEKFSDRNDFSRIST